MSIEQATQSFVIEATEILDDLESQLMALENDPGKDAVDAVFRAMHTIKGSGAMFGFAELAGFTHHLETAFERVRSGEVAISPDLIGVALRARDLMAELLAAGTDQGRAAEIAGAPAALDILTRVAELTGPTDRRSDKAAATDATGTEGAAASAPAAGYRVAYRPAARDLINGTRPDLLIAELLELGTGTVRYRADTVPALDSLDFDTARLGYDITLEGEIDRRAIDDVFIFADEAELDIQPIQPPAPAQTQGAAASPAKGADKAMGTAPPAPRARNLRVSGERIDRIMDTIGELVISQARLDQVGRKHADPELEGVIEEVERLVLALRDTTLSIRMLPIETVFSKFQRVVRDLSADLGKQVQLRTAGGETEIDKNVIDRLSEPLVHMIRNALDHGLEDRETREAAGKPPRGTVRLEARQEGGEVIIEVSDDGRGLDAAAIRAKAERQELISPDTQMTEAEIHRLIFAPGFSTAQAVSDVSGRGVGMDAVRSAVDELRGQIDLATRPGEGTRISLRLPVSLAIIEGLQVRLGAQVFVIPLSVVDECVEMEAAEATRASGRRMLEIRDELVPFVPLEEMLGLPSDAAPDDMRRVVVTRSDGMRSGFVVDDIIGQAQTVIKPLSQHHDHIAGLSGATILGDGSVALILDIAALAQSAGAPSLAPAA